MSDTGRKSWARVGVNRVQDEADNSGLSGPVISYTLSREEIERLYGPIEKKELPREFCKDWPHPGQSNKRHIALRDTAADEESNLEDVDLGGNIDLDEIARIESCDTDPAWAFDGCVWLDVEESWE